MKPKVGDTVNTGKGRATVVETDDVVAILEYSDQQFALVDVASIRLVKNNVISFDWKGE